MTPAAHGTASRSFPPGDGFAVAVGAAAEAVSAQRQLEERGMGLSPIAAVLPLDERAARAAIGAALRALAADPATAGLCAADLAMEVGRG